ncbi:MAG TPA: BatA domain-containing protein, partial [Xanthobacteraceae bacterium]
MIGALPLGFAEPFVLAGLLTLPVLWWLLRLIPPRPRRIDFPPTRLLLEIVPKEETPARTPWWLTLMRLMLAALVIVAAAGPLWHPPLAGTKSRAPVAILIDDGWSAAATWEARLRTADDIIARAEDDRRAVALVPLSQGPRDISLAPAGSARVRLHQLRPAPYTVDRGQVLPALSRFLAETKDAELVWLSDATDLGRGADFVKGLAQTIGQHPITVVAGGIAGARALTGAENAAGALTVKVLRAAAGNEESGTVRALDLKGLPLGDAPFAFKSNDRETEAHIDLPVEIRNDIARIEIAGERSAGAVQLLDKRWRRRTVGIVSGATADVAEPLLSSSYYVQRALDPFADVRLTQGESPADAVTHFLDQNLPMLILTDVGNVGDAHDKLSQWIEDGGVLVRFAGPRLAAAEDDDLVPVKLRRGGRVLGGSMSWDKPQPLAAFSRQGPFNGMPVPNDVTVTRQVLAEPDAALTENTWATLADGTPLVTAARRGKGLIVLFHVTGDTRWSDLPLSGTFVDMLKRIVSLAGTTAAADSDKTQNKTAREMLPASHALDGFGSFIAPPPTARPVPADYAGNATPEHPPGFYGPPEGLLAVNTLSASDRLAPLDFSPLVNATREIYRTSEPQDLRGPIFLAALALLLLDTLVVLFLGGGLQRLIPRSSRAATAAVLAVGMLVLAQNHAGAQQTTPNPNVPQSALETKLAYVVTGDA